MIEPAPEVNTLYLCGNSTVTDQPYDPYASWGQMIPRWFGESMAVSNHAESGLTARTFIASNRLNQICATLKKGDYVICEFGHNDEKEHQPGDGAWYHYIYNLKVFVDRVRDKGATIIFCTPTSRRFFNDDQKTLKNTHGDFPAAMLSVAEREQVPVIDLNGMTKTFFESSIPEGMLEAARIDGAGKFRTFFSIVLPLSKAIIAVMALYYAVGQWNSYFNAMIFLQDEKKYPLQLVLKEILIASESTVGGSGETILQQYRLANQLKYVSVIVSSLPVLCLYPFVQKYFAQGVMIGSLKG